MFEEIMQVHCERQPSTNIKMDRLELEKGQKFLLHYDYGDDWMFTISVQKIEETDEPVKSTLIRAKGEVEQYPSWDDWDEDDEI
jgi:hypothetical protein